MEAIQEEEEDIMNKLEVKFAPIGDVRSDAPSYATMGASGMDLRAALKAAIAINPGERRLVMSGWSLAIPRGYEGQVRSRSGLALKHGVVVLNSPGTIDADYRGEIGALLINHGSETFVVHPNDRIAQLVIVPIIFAQRIFVDVLDRTARGEGGFGSTGVS